MQVLPGVDGFIPMTELAPWRVDLPDHLFWVRDQVEAMIIQNKRQQMITDFINGLREKSEIETYL